MVQLSLSTSDTLDDRRWRVVQISISEQDASLLRTFLDARILDLNREMSHTDSPRFRETLYELEGVLQRLLAQLPQDTATSS
jgi:hypothetical protein